MNILVRGTNWIGDAVMTIPAIRKLRGLFPAANLTLQTRQGTAGVFHDSGLFDEIITPSSVLDQVRAIRKRHFDLAVIFPNSFESALVARLGGAKRIFGYASGGRSFLLTHPVPVPDWKKSRHEVFYYLELVAAVERSFDNAGEVSDVDVDPQIFITDERRSKARQLLARYGVYEEKKTVALAAGSTNSRAKRWLPERFAELNDRLQSELDVNVVLLGSSGDKEVSDSVSSMSSSRPIDLTGATDVAAVAAILSEVDLLVSNDMGLAHLAPAVGTKTIVIFGPTDPVTTRPFSESATIVSANVECAPCMLRECPIDHRCMTRVSAEEVFSIVRRSLFEIGDQTWSTLTPG